MNEIIMKTYIVFGSISKYAFTGYIRKWVSDKKSDTKQHLEYIQGGKPKKEKFKNFHFLH